jgi:hypothetical protein
VTEDTTTFPTVNIVGIIVAIISVILRVTNRILAWQIGWDDYTIISALVCLQTHFKTKLTAAASRCCDLRCWISTYAFTRVLS